MKKKNLAKSSIAGSAILVILFCILSGTAGAGDQSGDESPQAVIDRAGRRISVEKPYQRIISLYGAHTENLFSLGLDKEIIGVSRHESYPQRALMKPIFSYHDDPEKFLAARPDLVFVRPMIDRGYPQLVKRLEKSGIVVVSLQPATVSEMFAYWKTLGILTGRPIQALEMATHFQKISKKFQSVASAIKVKKKVYFESIHSKMKTFSPDSMAIFVLETAGGINVAKDAKPVRNTNIAAYGKERILSRANQIDVFLSQSGAMNRPTISMIKNEPGFSAIKAVYNNQVFIIDEQIVSRPTLRLLQGIDEIGKILYPDVYIKIQLNQHRQQNVDMAPLSTRGGHN
jgi:iron complex transport system substrate-binding protein